MGTADVQTLTAEEVRRERDSLLSTLGMPFELAEQLAEADALDGEQYATLRRIRDLTWLLGE